MKHEKVKTNCQPPWGLVVNEAVACRITVLVSDNCDCAEDLPARVDRLPVFRYGDVADMARLMRLVIDEPIPTERIREAADGHHLRHTAVEDCTAK